MSVTDGNRIGLPARDDIDQGSHSQRASDEDPGSRIRTLLGGEETGGQLALLYSVERRGSEPPRHAHRNEDEVVYVLDGEITYYVDDEEVRVRTGDSLFLPRGREHSYILTSDEVCLLVILMPAGLESYYQELAGLPALPGIERLVTTAARYGIEITGPPLSA